MTRGNSNGGYASTPELTMRAFDNLPPTARAALRDAAICWATQPILSRHRDGRKGYRLGKDVAATVAGWDKARHTKDARKGLVAPLFKDQPLTPQRRK